MSNKRARPDDEDRPSPQSSFAEWYSRPSQQFDTTNVHYHHVARDKLTAHAAWYLAGSSGELRLAPGASVQLWSSATTPSFEGIIETINTKHHEDIVALLRTAGCTSDDVEEVAYAVVASCFITKAATGAVVFQPVSRALAQLDLWKRSVPTVPPASWSALHSQFLAEKARQYDGLVPVSPCASLLCLLTLVQQLGASLAKPFSELFPPLPAPWQYRVKPSSGRPQFYNPVTKASRDANDPPEGCTAIPSRAPHGWAFACSVPSGKLQLYNVATGSIETL